MPEVRPSRSRILAQGCNCEGTNSLICKLMTAWLSQSSEITPPRGFDRLLRQRRDERRRLSEDPSTFHARLSSRISTQNRIRSAIMAAKRRRACLSMRRQWKREKREVRDYKFRDRDRGPDLLRESLGVSTCASCTCRVCQGTSRLLGISQTGAVSV